MPVAVARATEYAEQGELSSAVLAFEEATELHPEDVRAWLGLAAVRHERGEDPLAVDAFARAAALYVSRDEILKAIAVYKQATRIAPMRDDLALELAGQYRRQGLDTEAVEQLFAALTARAHRGELLDCLSVIQTALELDKENIGDRVRLAEELSSRGRASEAMEAYSEVIDRLDGAAHRTIYEMVARRMVHHGGAPLTVLLDLAQMELESGSYEAALTLLREAHAGAPGDARTLGALADAFEGLGQAQPAVVALRHQAERYAALNMSDERGATLERILSLAPDDPWARRARDGVSSMPLEELVFTEQAQGRGELERTLSSDDAVEATLEADPDEDGALVRRYGSGLDALFAASSAPDAAEPPVEEILTRDIVAVEDAEGVEILATRDILSVELSPEDAALLELDLADDEDDVELLATRDIVTVDLEPEDYQALSLDPGDDEA